MSTVDSTVYTVRWIQLNGHCPLEPLADSQSNRPLPPAGPYRRHPTASPIPSLWFCELKFVHSQHLQIAAFPQLALSSQRSPLRIPLKNNVENLVVSDVPSNVPCTSISPFYLVKLALFNYSWRISSGIAWRISRRIIREHTADTQQNSTVNIRRVHYSVLQHCEHLNGQQTCKQPKLFAALYLSLLN